jgi:UDP-glucose 4-epimerase
MKAEAASIGSHICVNFLNFDKSIVVVVVVVVVNNSSHSKSESIHHIRQIADQNSTFYELNLIDRYCFEKVITENEIVTIIDSVSQKTVNKSFELSNIYSSNFDHFIVFAMKMKCKLKKMIFRFSVTVSIMKENLQSKETNVYDNAKQFIKDIQTKVKNVFQLVYLKCISSDESSLKREYENDLKSFFFGNFN